MATPNLCHSSVLEVRRTQQVYSGHSSILKKEGVWLLRWQSKRACDTPTWSVWSRARSKYSQVVGGGGVSKKNTWSLLRLVLGFNDLVYKLRVGKLGTLGPNILNFPFRWEQCSTPLSGTYLFWLWSPVTSKPRNSPRQNFSVREGSHLFQNLPETWWQTVTRFQKASYQ